MPCVASDKLKFAAIEEVFALLAAPGVISAAAGIAVRIKRGETGGVRRTLCIAVREKEPVHYGFVNVPDLNTLCGTGDCVIC